MSPSRTAPLSKRRAARFKLASCVTALCIAACTDPRPEIIARFPGDAGGASAIGAAGASGESGAGAATAPVVHAQRDRVKVVNGKLVTDINTPLRGLTLPVDTGWTLTQYDFDLITTIAQTSGLNTLHVYLENSTLVSGAMESEADALVALTAQAGMYLIIGFGTGTALNSFDQAKITSFWQRYAARYADRTQVLFEIQNDPESTCDKPVLAATLTMERAAYKLIRSLAPDSHVLLLSTPNLTAASVLESAITSLSSDVDWSNASIAMDVTDLKSTCLPFANLSDLTDVANAHGVPLLIGQLPPTDWGPYITQFEQAKIGWMQFTYFADPGSRDLPSYLSATSAAGVTWCPDQGKFPEDASSCH